MANRWNPSRTVSMVAAAAMVALVIAPIPARGEPGPVSGGAETVSALIVRVAEADQRLQHLVLDVSDLGDGGGQPAEVVGWIVVGHRTQIGEVGVVLVRHDLYIGRHARIPLYVERVRTVPN
ncbi:hypothetical protein ASD37_02105 [Mycobacterium sp. Root135]|nr:hypothetical protein ASD37_02105 [Mycobacterium sp. Root135]